jgi:hypothetical protein
MNHRQATQKAKKDVTLLRWVFVLSFIAQTMLYATGGTPTGSGTITDPFLVADYADLKAVGTTTTYTLGAVYRLTGDIDASASATENSGAGFVPIGNRNATMFIGTFQGAGHVIKNLYINCSATLDVGLFGDAWGATIDSLGVLNANIKGAGGYAGCIAGENYFGTISNCYATGSVTDSGGVGGIVGWNPGTITNCYATVAVTGFESAGGVVGYNQGPMSNCYSTGTVTGQDYIGGVAGFNLDIITNCYATGTLTGSIKVGGVVGANGSPGKISNCYWNTQTTGCPSGYGQNEGTFSGSGFTTTQMQQSSSFSGWDFTTVWSINSNINHGYPYLASIMPTFVEGAAVVTPENFILLQNYPNPFNPSTVIRYQLPSTSMVSLKVFDLLGKEVATLVNEVKAAGSYSVEWNASKFVSGVYFYTLRADNFVLTNKMMLTR